MPTKSRLTWQSIGTLVLLAIFLAPRASIAEQLLVSKGTKEVVAYFNCFDGNVPIYCSAEICIVFSNKSNNQPGTARFSRWAFPHGTKDLDVHVGRACFKTKGPFYELRLRALSDDLIVNVPDEFGDDQNHTSQQRATALRGAR
jgi:hypothetical protein